MGVADLLERVRFEGKNRVTAVEANRDEQLAAIAARRDAEITELEREFAERSELETRLTRDRARSWAALERRKALLEARWRAIDAVLLQARERLPGEDDYFELLSGLASRYAVAEAMVHLSRVDTERYGGKLNSGLGDPVDISGGLIVDIGRQVIDCSLDESLDAMRGELSAMIARELFADESD